MSIFDAEVGQRFVDQLFWKWKPYSLVAWSTVKLIGIAQMCAEVNPATATAAQLCGSA